MSFNAERLACQGRRAELRQEEKDLRIRIAALRDQMRLMLSPLHREDELQAESLASLAVELRLKHVALLGVLDETERIREILGR